MPYFNKHIQTFLFLALFAIPLFFLNIHNVHPAGGDDYAQYIKEAQNIANGKPYYQSNYVFNKYNNCYSPPQYPPGFPLLLAPVVKIWGIAIMPMCYFNTVIAVCLLFSFFIFFRKYAGSVSAFCLAVIISYSGIMIDLKQLVLADESCLLFVMLYLIFRNARRFSWQRVSLLIVFASMAILIRTQSVLLVFAEMLYIILFVIREWIRQKKFTLTLICKIPSLYIIAGSLLLSVFLNSTVFYSPTSALQFYVDFLQSTLQKGVLTIVRDNINSFLATISGFFHYDTENSIRTAIVTVMGSAGLLFCIIGFVIKITGRLSFDDLFFILLCGLMLYYPIHDSRYFLPAIAIVYYYCYAALEKILPVLTKIRLRNIGLGITAVYLIAGFHYFKTTTEMFPYGYMPLRKDMLAVSYISKNISDSDIIVCARPRLTTLYTNKKCMVHAWQYPMDVNRRVFDSMRVKYILLNGFSYTDDYYHTYLNNFQHPIDSTYLAQGYMLYTLR